MTIPAGKGFTLIELVIIIMILSIASVSLVSMYGQVAGTVGINKDITIAAQMAQECGEYLLAQRRTNGYAMSSISDCSSGSNPLLAFNGYGPPTVTMTDISGSAGCPTTPVASPPACKLFHITASYDTGAAEIDLVVVDY